MATVYKSSLESTVPLLIVMLSVLPEIIPFASSDTSGHILRMEYSGKERYPHEITLTKNHKVDKRKPVDVKLTTILPKRHIPTVKAQTRSTAKLHCNISEVDESENVTLIWAKKNDKNEFIIITTLQMVETTGSITSCVEDDKRFIAKQNGTDWCLHIRYTLNSDAGIYQCQICHGFPPSKCSTSNVVLRLIDAHAKIFGGPRKFIPSDKELPLRLSCVLINSIEPPSYIFWYHGDRMINYDLEDGATVREGPQGSELIFPKPNKTHVGNYSCVPSNAQLDSVMVYYDDIASVQLEDGSGGKKTHPEDHVVNMLVLMSTFHLTR